MFTSTVPNVGRGGSCDLPRMAQAPLRGARMLTPYTTRVPLGSYRILTRDKVMAKPFNRWAVGYTSSYIDRHGEIPDSLPVRFRRGRGPLRRKEPAC